MKDYRYKDVHAIEIPKTVELRDCMNNLWFVVSMKVDESDYHLQYTRYCVSVYAKATERTVEYRPRTEEKFDPKFGDYDYCRKLFDEYVANYTTLVKASTRGLQDMDVYAEKTGYRHDRPRCCATCQFSRLRRTGCDYVHEVTNRLECWNEENQEEYHFDIKPELRYNPPCDDYHHFAGDIPPERRRRPRLDVHPTVDPLGVCDHYVPRAEETFPYPGQSVSEFIDQRMGVRLDSKISCSVVQTLSTDSAISGTVERVVCNVISSPGISSALEAPVAAAMQTPSVCAATTVIVKDVISKTSVDVIIGNDKIGNMRDRDGDNIPDEYEEEEIIFEPPGA